MSDKVIAWLRTVLPGLWSALVTYLVVHFALPDGVGLVLNTFWEAVAYPAVLAAVYPVLRWLETRVPQWLARLLVGSATRPVYSTSQAYRPATQRVD
ncbi:hypothetical protein ALI144C_44790 [Actinosynnema sp. ALI-1.44]|uniref:hypothetical protein n=1 Tax=Actinosynnema sp. ALI-1.44 TaxID=1933779 RepID=UPI00097C0C94|nr:hypothetical protein [Actinosynnema sp. ALI-1.44]ONI73072.1 hypothetical protein ALI144C_44790 [Actinosynnema sp. ALI-1.44]